MRQGMIACDACKEEFEATSIEVQEEELCNDRLGMFFVCPACGIKFPFAGITKKGLELRPRLEKLVVRIQKAQEEGKTESYQALVQRHRELLAEYSKEVTGPYKEEEVVK